MANIAWYDKHLGLIDLLIWQSLKASLSASDDTFWRDNGRSVNVSITKVICKNNDQMADNIFH